MSDYIYMLESHLSSEQNQVVEEVQRAAAGANVNLFLTGGAMRDMLTGHQIRDLDFVVEGPALKLARSVSERSGARTVSVDEARKSAELVFPSGVTAQIAMSRQERYARSGAKPQISAATIQEDLRGRDFTCNAVALSLNKASRGLLLDPMNGLADIERRELRAVSTHGFYDDPSRLLRLVRFRARLEFSIEERTQMQMSNALEAQVLPLIPAKTLGDELRCIATEDNVVQVVKGLEDGGFLGLFSSALAGPKSNAAGIARFEKVLRLLPDDVRWRPARQGPFLWVFTEKLAAKEKQSLVKAVELSKSDVDGWLKLEARARKLEAAIRAPRIRKPSHVYHLVAGAQPDEVIFLLYQSASKPVQERLRNYFQKYLPLIQDIPPEEWATLGAEPGTPKYAKAREEFLTERLNRKPKKEEPEPEVVPVPVPVPLVEAATSKRFR
jgi:tRNA nucleotidyltransferase (CCA-adding enzyme)